MQTPIQNLLDEMTANGDELGIQAVVYHRGELIVDAWSGIADRRTGRQVDGDTLFPVFSVSKGMVATIVHQLAEEGILSYDRPIADVWPEFAANGKEGVTLRQALNHSSGIPHMPQGIGFSELSDWDSMCAAVAALAPVFPPGSRDEYHAITYGWIAGETACRASGKSFPQLLRERIAIPLGLDGLYIGIPEGADLRIAVLEDANPPNPPADLFAPSAIPGWLGPLHEFMNRPEMHRACIPATSGVMNARSIAKHYAALLPGGIAGVRLLPQSRIREATASQGLNDLEGNPAQRGLGYMRYEQYSAAGSGVIAFGNGGFGGAAGFADPARGIAIGITKNRLNSGDTAGRVFQALLAGLGLDTPTG
jgi:CubicO group peptidase (beta-lactamase class C family)